MHKTWIYTQKYLYFLFFLHLSICLSIWKHDISFIWALSFSMFIPTSLRVRNLASIYFQCMYLFTQSSWCNLSSDHVGRLLHSYVVLVKSVWCSLAVGWFLLDCSFHLSLYCRPIGQTHHPLTYQLRVLSCLVVCMLRVLSALALASCLLSVSSTIPIDSGCTTVEITQLLNAGT